MAQKARYSTTTLARLQACNPTAIPEAEKANNAKDRAEWVRLGSERDNERERLHSYQVRLSYHTRGREGAPQEVPGPETPAPPQTP